jgi:prepilin-type N-terminal cleavage/methylation domain-containing protein/prepilin-type processing-associated H-X9-DG protein
MDRRTPIARSRPRAFTLVELLVVIGIIAVLISILLPALSKARKSSIFTVCAERQRQFVMACQMYAQENRGFFPRYDFVSGGNLWDVKVEMMDLLRDRYNYLKKMWFCPDIDTRLSDSLYLTYYPTFYRLGFSYWVPRKNQNGMIPPDPGPSSTYNVKDKDIFRGPIQMSDRYGNFDPIITDSIFTDPAASPDVDLSVNGTSLRSGSDSWSPHRAKDGTLMAINAGFADGHVQRIQGSEVKARYMGNWWNWR